MLSGLNSGLVFGTSCSAEEFSSKAEESKNFAERIRYTKERSEKTKMEDDESLNVGSNPRKRHHDSDLDDTHDSNSANKRSHNTEETNAEERANIKLMIPSAVMGSVIGKGGETIGTLQKESGCRVKVSKNADFFPHTTERVALISGPVSAMMRVIAFLCDKYRDKSDLPSKTDPFDHKAVDRSKQVKLIVPSTSTGMIIGKGGEHIKSIKEVTQFQVQISPKDALDPRLGERVITVAGRQLDDAVAGVRMILNKVALDSSSSLASYTNVSYANFFDQSSASDGPAPLFLTNQDARAPLMMNRPLSPTRSSFLSAAYNSSMLGAPAGPPPSSYYRQSRSAQTPPPQSTAAPSQFASYRATSPLRTNGAAAGGAPSAGLFDSLHNQSQSGVNLSQWLQQQQQTPPTTPANQSASGMGNLQVLQFLDGLRSTLRTNGYNDLAISEITQAMHTLAKYNVLGLGLGFGLAAVSKAPTSDLEFGNTSQLSNQQLAANQAAPQLPLMPPMPPPVFGNAPSLMSGAGFAGFDALKMGNLPDAFFNRSLADRSQSLYPPTNAGNDHSRGRDDSSSSLGYVSRSTLRAEQHSPVRGRSPNFSRPPHFNVQPSFNESRRDDTKIELTVPESAIGAILGKQGRNLADIQRYSGARIDVSKRDSHFSPGNGPAPDRFIILQGPPDAVHTARRKIEACVDDSRRGKRRQGDERF